MIRLSCCQWGLNKRPDSTEVSNLNLLAGLGFRAVDICPSMQRTEGAKATARKLGIRSAVYPSPMKHLKGVPLIPTTPL